MSFFPHCKDVNVLVDVFQESQPFNLFAHHAHQYEFFSLSPKPPSGYQVVFLCDRKSFFLKPIDGHKSVFCFMTYFFSQSKPPSGLFLVIKFFCYLWLKPFGNHHVNFLLLEWNFFFGDQNHVGIMLVIFIRRNKNHMVATKWLNFILNAHWSH